MENCILYDWLTFTHPFWSLEDAQQFLGLAGLSGWVLDLPSRYHYAQRAMINGIHIHYTPCDSPGKYNPGVCVEFSGAGCRFFETVSQLDLQALCDSVRAAGLKITRLDVAYDDFTGVIDLEKMAQQCSDFHFTSRLQRCEVIRSSKISESEVSGLTVTHGSRESNIFMRIYDKKYERSRDDVEHWVRFEIMLRDENACGFIDNAGSIGEKWAGTVKNYLMYRDVGNDSNKRRWKVSDWWSALLGDAQRIRLATRKDEEYNIDKFRDFVYKHMKKTFLTALHIDGVYFILNMLERGLDADFEFSHKQEELIRRFSYADKEKIQSFLDFIQEYKKTLRPGDHSEFAELNKMIEEDAILREQAERAARLLASDPAGSPGPDPAGSSGSDPAGSSGSDPAGSSGSDPAGSPGSDPAGSPGSDPAGSS